MKKIIPIPLLLMTATASFNQQPNPASALEKQDWLQKSRHQKTAAWILLGGGLLSTGLGTLSGMNLYGHASPDNPFYVKENNTGGTIFLVTGLAAIGGSIPLFITAAKNRKRAAHVSFMMESTPVVQPQYFINHAYPAVSFKIAFK